jgi:hypothetical protein
VFHGVLAAPLVYALSNIPQVAHSRVLLDGIGSYLFLAGKIVSSQSYWFQKRVSRRNFSVFPGLVMNLTKIIFNAIKVRFKSGIRGTMDL